MNHHQSTGPMQTSLAMAFIHVFQVLMFGAYFLLWVFDGYSQTMVQSMFSISIILSLAYCAQIRLDLRFLHIFTGLYIALHGLFPLLAPFFNYPLEDEQSLGLYAFFTMGGLHLFHLSYSIFRSRESEPSTFTINHRRLEIVVIAVLLIYMSSIALITYGFGSLSSIYALSRSELKASTNLSTIVALYIINLSSVIFVLLPTYLKQRRSMLIPFTILLLIVEAFILAAYRARSASVAHAFALIYGHFVLAPRINQSSLDQRSRRVPRMRYIKLAMAVAIVLVMGVSLRFLRVQVLEKKDVQGVSQMDLGYMMEKSVLGGDLGYTPIVLQIMDLVPEHHPYLYGQSYYRLLFIPVPRTIWRNKPPNTAVIVGHMIQPGNPYYSAGPGLQGDLYLNFGMWGILGFIAYGLLLARMDAGRGLTRYLCTGISFSLIFKWTRGSFSSAAVVLLMIFCVACVIEQVLQVRRNE